MTGFCDNCGEAFFKATSKFCSACGQQRVFPTTEDVAIEGVHLDAIKELDGIEEQANLVPFWNVPGYTGTQPITLYLRVYGKKPHGVDKDVLWGKKFLKSFTQYHRQHKKLYRNYCIVREWFLPGSNDFVDKVLNTSSLRWNKLLKKEIAKYCEDKQKSGPKKDLIKTLDFPNEGLVLRWKTSDIVRHVSTIKKYRRSSKGRKSKCLEDPSQIASTSTEIEVFVPEVPIVISEVPVDATEVPIDTVEVQVDVAEVPTIALEVPIHGAEVAVNRPRVRQGKRPRIRKPSLKVREEAS